MKITKPKWLSEDEDEALKCVKQLDNPNQLKDAAVKSPSLKARLCALKRLNECDYLLLKEIAEANHNEEIIEEANKKAALGDAIAEKINSKAKQPDFDFDINDESKNQEEKEGSFVIVQVQGKPYAKTFHIEDYDSFIYTAFRRDLTRLFKKAAEAPQVAQFLIVLYDCELISPDTSHRKPYTDVLLFKRKNMELIMNKRILHVSYGSKTNPNYHARSREDALVQAILDAVKIIKEIK